MVYTRVASPKAALLLFHGCSHSAKDWGFDSAACTGCIGARACCPAEQRHDLMLASSTTMLEQAA